MIIFENRIIKNQFSSETELTRVRKRVKFTGWARELLWAPRFLNTQSHKVFVDLNVRNNLNHIQRIQRIIGKRS
jgi:hypothetical protein